MPMKHENKKLCATIRTSLGRAIWPVILVIALAAAGHLALKRQTPRPPPQPVSPVPLPQTDWRGVDHAVVDALAAAHKAAEAAANEKLDAWTKSLMLRVDADFLPWYFGYWNQQTLGLKSAWYWAAHQLGINQSGAGERIAGEIQQQFAQRVMRPEIAQMELERIANETLQVYVNELGPRLAAIPQQYHVPQPEWDRYLSDIAVLTTRTQGNRQVSLTLKTVAASGVVGSILIARTLGPEIRTMSAGVSGKLAETASGEIVARAGGTAAAKVGGEALGEIIGAVIIVWDVADHYRTRQVELPILRRNIADYLGQLKHRLLCDPQDGIITVLDGMEASIASSQRAMGSTRR